MPTLNSDGLSHHIEQCIQSGMTQIKNGEYMDFGEFNLKVMAIPL